MRSKVLRINAKGDKWANETEFRSDVVKAANDLGWFVQYTHDSRRGPKLGNGFPDLVLVRDRVLYRELKMNNTYLQPNQKIWRDLLFKVKENWAVWRPRDWDAILDQLR